MSASRIAEDAVSELVRLLTELAYRLRTEAMAEQSTSAAKTHRIFRNSV